MKKIFMAAGVLAWVLLGIIPLTTYAGGVFVTGHDSDFHAIEGNTNSTGARHIIQRAVAYVTFDKLNPMLLLVTDLRDPDANFNDSRVGMTAAGFTYDVADYGSGTPGVLDLNTVDFNNYDAIVVASDYGGWLRQDELDILNARTTELTNYVNTGNRGIVAFSESGTGGLTTHNRYGFLPFLVSEVTSHQDEAGFTVTAAGVAMGLTDADVNGNFSHSLFVETGGMDVIDIDAEGRPISLATRKTVSTGGVEVCDNDIDDDGDELVDCDDPDCATDPACLIQVGIDIKPGSFPNSINLDSAGVIPVAILSSSTFDATTVDPTTVSLAGARVKLVGKSDKYLAHEEDVNGDSLLDLVCQVLTAEFMIEPGESMAVLEAETYDGTLIRGVDTVRIVQD